MILFRLFAITLSMPWWYYFIIDDITIIAIDYISLLILFRFHAIDDAITPLRHAIISLIAAFIFAIDIFIAFIISPYAIDTFSDAMMLPHFRRYYFHFIFIIFIYWYCALLMIAYADAADAASPFDAIIDADAIIFAIIFAIDAAITPLADDDGWLLLLLLLMLIALRYWLFHAITPRAAISPISPLIRHFAIATYAGWCRWLLMPFWCWLRHAITLLIIAAIAISPRYAADAIIDAFAADTPCHFHSLTPCW